MTRTQKKLVVIGLDCASPELIFEKWIDDLPNFRRLISSAVYGRLKSTIPPITIPAWASMLTGMSPGHLGVYGFRNRRSHKYGDESFAVSSSVRYPMIWELLSNFGKSSVVIGVPQTYPPKPFNGKLVSGLLTPGNQAPYTHPLSLKQELENKFGDIIFDIDHFRELDKRKLAERIREMSDQRFALADYLMQNSKWDFSIFVDMGPDRLHHGFWKYMDETHPKHNPDSPFADIIKDYYKHLDTLIGNLTAQLDPDTAVIIVSDHGAQAMHGGVCLNEWLRKKGLLTLKQEPEKPSPLNFDMIDWKNTKAWGYGGYCGRICLNVVNREPEGTVEQQDFEKMKNSIAENLISIKRPDGSPMNNRIFDPRKIYSPANGIPPDLIVYFDDLKWRSVGSVGTDSIYTFENDLGPDDANHSEYGIYILHSPHFNKSVSHESNLLNITPTILQYFNLPSPDRLIGQPITADFR